MVLHHLSSAVPPHSTPINSHNDEERNADQEDARSVVTVGNRASLPTMYVADETTSPEAGTNIRQGPQRTHLRFRNCSQGEGSSPALSTVRSTPTYGTPGSFASNTTDSGVEVNESFLNWDPKDDSGFRFIPISRIGREPIHGDKEAEGSYMAPPSYTDFNQNRSPDTDTGLRGLFGTASKRRRGKALFDSEPVSFSLDVAMPLLLIMVVLGCTLFTVMTLSAGMRKMPPELMRRVEEVAKGGDYDGYSGRALNGKYLSMDYAVRRKLEKLREAGKLLPEDVSMDENGNAIGGKKASIQYAYQLQQGQDGGEYYGYDDGEYAEPDYAPSDEDNLAALAQLLEAKPEETEQMAAKRKELVDKLSSFGHFSTTAVEQEEVVDNAIESDSEPDSEEDSEEDSKDEYDVPDLDDKLEYDEMIKVPLVVGPQPRVKSPKVKTPKKSLPLQRDAPSEFGAITKKILDGQLKVEEAVEKKATPTKDKKKAPSSKKGKKTPVAPQGQSRRDNPFKKRIENRI